MKFAAVVSIAWWLGALCWALAGNAWVAATDATIGVLWITWAAA